MADLLVKALSPIAGNALAQALLQRHVNFSLKLMGIGTGAGVAGSGEQGVLRVLRKHSVAPYCIFDVGANRGQFLEMVLSRTSDEECIVHSFEPSRDAFETLRTKPRGRRVQLNNTAIGKQRGESILYFDAPGSTMASLTNRELSHRGIDFAQHETVQVETIDHYCAQHGVDRISLLKIDIEGHERDALAGAQEMFARRAVDVVTFEFGGANIDTHTSLRDFWRFFQSHDMNLYRITPSGYMAPVSRYREIEEQYRTTNFTAIRKG